MDLFADLPDAPKAVAPTADMFADLPVATGAMPFEPKTFGTDWKQAKAAIDAMPPDRQRPARDIYADYFVGQERAQPGGIGRETDDNVRRAVRSVPYVGTWADEFAAGMGALGGNDYEMQLAYERAKDRAIDRTPSTQIGTLPGIGPVTTGGVAQGLGIVGGSLATPMFRVAQGAGAGAMALNVGANAGAAGVVEGAGEAQRNVDMLGEGAWQGARSAALGGAVGGVAGRIGQSLAGGAAAGARASDPAIEAGNRIGVSLPAIATTPDTLTGRAARELSAGLAQIPLVGTPLNRAAERSISELDDAARRIADAYAPGITVERAGETGRDAINDWIQKGSKATNNVNYGSVRQAIPPTATGDLPTTRALAAQLDAEDAAAGIRTNASTTKFVGEALSRPQGLTFDGAMRLRTAVGAMRDDALLPAAGTRRPALDRIYSALTDDIERMSSQLGGATGRAAWENANTTAAGIARDRERLSKIVGLQGDVSGEAFINRIMQMAGSKATADMARLRLARSTIAGTNNANAQQWDEVAAAVIPRLGAGADGTFSPIQFLNRYSSLSDQGRQTLFASSARPGLSRQLDDLAQVSQRFRALDRLRNTSGTGRVNAVIGAGSVIGGAGVLGILNHVLAVAIPSHIAARVMAQPARVRQITTFNRAVYAALLGRPGALTRRELSVFSASIARDTGEQPSEVENRLASGLAGVPIGGKN